MTKQLEKLRNRLLKIGIRIDMSANYPWIYLDKVNGNTVTDKHKANHGFTIAMLTMTSEIELSGRRLIFKTIRKFKG